MAETSPLYFGSQNNVWRVSIELTPEGIQLDDAYVTYIDHALEQTNTPLAQVAVTTPPSLDRADFRFSLCTDQEKITPDAIGVLHEAHYKIEASIGRILSMRAVLFSVYGDRSDGRLNNARLSQDFTLEAVQTERRLVEIERDLRAMGQAA
jgi:hypothetical protein